MFLSCKFSFLLLMMCVLRICFSHGSYVCCSHCIVPIAFQYVFNELADSFSFVNKSGDRKSWHLYVFICSMSVPYFGSRDLLCSCPVSRCWQMFVLLPGLWIWVELLFSLRFFALGAQKLTEVVNRRCSQYVFHCYKCDL